MDLLIWFWWIAFSFLLQDMNLLLTFVFWYVMRVSIYINTVVQFMREFYCWSVKSGLNSEQCSTHHNWPLTYKYPNVVWLLWFFNAITLRVRESRLTRPMWRLISQSWFDLWHYCAPLYATGVRQVVLLAPRRAWSSAAGLACRKVASKLYCWRSIQSDKRSGKQQWAAGDGLPRKCV